MLTPATMTSMMRSWPAGVAAEPGEKHARHIGAKQLGVGRAVLVRDAIPVAAEHEPPDELEVETAFQILHKLRSGMVRPN